MTSSPIAREHGEVVRAIARTKALVSTFDRSPYCEETLSKARRMWQVRMVAEYRSTAVFAALVPQLLEAAAPMETVTVVMRMAQDEVAHAEICRDAVRALGANATLDRSIVSQPLPLHRGRPVEERVLRNIIYGCCLTEVINCARFVDTLEHTTDPYFHDVLRRLLADERLHGQFGFHYLELCRPWLEENAEVRASISRYLEHAFAVLEGELSGAGSKRPPLTDEERAIGMPDPLRLPETFYVTVQGAIVPGLERFGIEASAAWRNRRRR